ncbi:MAG: T9SS type A sorting domain-containing protein [Bacteroidetes bacterium]|nr:T9SS type A sorting domain-containing protein [Bacteroidota bacterium]
MKNIIYKNKICDVSNCTKYICAIICFMFCGIVAQSQTVAKAEYRFDDDKGVGKNTQVSLILAADSTWVLPTISTSGLAVGYHVLYIRTRDSNKKWSQTTRINIEIVANETQTKDSIIAAEYFIDFEPSGGYGFATDIPLSQKDSSITQSFTIPTSVFASLPIGYHTIYGRVKNKLGLWSETFRNNIELIKSEDARSVVKVEYFFSGNDDIGFGACYSKTISIKPPFTVDKDTFYIPLNQLTYGNNITLYIRAKESVTGIWSQTAKKGGLNVVPPGPRLATTTEENSYSMYPNPVSDHLNIDLANFNQETMQFILTNLVGEVMQSQEIKNQSTQIKINQPPGVYFVTLNSSTQTITKKLVIQ